MLIMQKNIFITGCSSGIGLVTALDLQSRGYHVIASCRRAADIEHLNQQGLAGLLLDLDSASSVSQAIEQVMALSGGRLFALINNAGFGLYGKLEALERQQLEQQFASNFFGVHQLTVGLLPALRCYGAARIINISSVMGLISTPGRGAYAASKYALEAWSDALRMELSADQIRVSLVEPGPITSAFSQNVQQADSAQQVKNPDIAARFALPPSALLPKIRHALETRYPRHRYPVTLVAHAMSIARRLLPSYLLDKILNHQPKN